MKRKIYIAFFILLGLLLQFLVHAVIEIWYINLLLENFSKYGLGFSWDAWLAIHHLFSVTLVMAGATWGFYEGGLWWHRLYELRAKN